MPVICHQEQSSSRKKSLILLHQPKARRLHLCWLYPVMKTPTTCTAVLLALCFVASSPAADERGTAIEKNQSTTTEKSTGANGYVFRARSRPADSTTTTAAANSEVFQDVVIPVGKNVMIESSMDYSSSSTVAVAVLCNACTTKTTSLSALGLVLEARWLPLNASSDIATQNASTFAYSDAGGAVFNVYAEQFNLELQNKGTGTITIDQVTIFRRAQ
jgi:hypothetical protein